MTTYLFVTKPEQLPARVKSNKVTWWSCNRKTENGDSAFVHITGVGITFEWRVVSDAKPDKTWENICDVEYVQAFDPPIDIGAIRAIVKKGEWAALDSNFRRRAEPIPLEVVARIRALRSGKQIDVKYPAYKDIELPLLKLLYERRGEMLAEDTYMQLADYFRLSDFARTQTRDDVRGDGKNEPDWNMRVQWARNNLAKGGYLERTVRSVWKLSKNGTEKAKTLKINVGSNGQIQSVPIPKVFVFRPGCNVKPASTTANHVQQELTVNLRHNVLQDALYKNLVVEWGAENVGTELSNGLGNSVDLVVRQPEGFWFYEIKTYHLPRDCVREAIGQLLEYSFWPGSQEACRFIIIGEGAPDDDVLEYCRRLSQRFSLPIQYEQIVT